MYAYLNTLVSVVDMLMKTSVVLCCFLMFACDVLKYQPPCPMYVPSPRW